MRQWFGRHGRALAVAGGLLALIVVVVLVKLVPSRSLYYTDGLSVRQPGKLAPLRLVLWEQPEPVEGRFNAGGDSYEPRLSADGRTMIFTRGRPGENADLYVSSFDGRVWSDPTPLAHVNTEQDELGPELSSDGRLLYFYSDRPGGAGGYDLWVAEWDGADWQAPVNLGAAVNSAFNEYGPALMPGDQRLFFSSNRPRRDLTEREKARWQATLRRLPLDVDYDIYVAGVDLGQTVAEDAESSSSIPVFSEAERVAALCSPADEGQIDVTPRGDFLYFGSNREGGFGGFDLYRCRIISGEYVGIENLGPPINSPANEMDPTLHLEGFGIYFSSDRDAPDPGSYRLYRSVSRDVMLRYDLSLWANLAGILVRLKWWLLAMLVAVAAILYMLRMLTDQQLRAHRSLLNKCLMGSVLFHLLLLLLLSFWIISSEVVRTMGEAAMEVAVNIDALAREKMALDIREDVTQLPTSSDALLVQQDMERLPVPDIQPRERAMDPIVSATAVDAFAVQSEPIEVAEQRPAVEKAEVRTELPSMEVAMFDIRMEERPVREAESTREVQAQITQPTVTPASFTPPTPEARPVASLPELRAATERRLSSPEEAIEMATVASAVRPMAEARLPSIELAMMDMRLEEHKASGGEREAQVRVDAPLPAAGQTAYVPSRDVPTTAERPVLTGEVARVNQVAALYAIADRMEAAAAPRFQQDRRRPSSLPEMVVEATLAFDVATRSVEAKESVVKLIAAGPVANPSSRSTDVRQEARRARSNPKADPAARLSDVVLKMPPVLESTRDLPRFDGLVRVPTAQLPSIEIAAALKLDAPEAVSDPYFLRNVDRRGELLAELGGDDETEATVRRALDWFSRNQEADGRWPIAKHGGEAGHDVASTSFALLCYFGWGATHVAEGPYKANVAKAIDWLLAQMKPDGDIRGTQPAGNGMYDQGIGTTVLAEAYGLTRDPRLKEAVQRAINFICAAQHKQTGGWRYVPNDAGDTSVFGWQFMALTSAETAGLSVDPAVFNLAGKWLDSVGGGAHGGLYGYQNKGDIKPAMPPEAMFCRQLSGVRPEDPRMQETARYLQTHLPERNHWDYYTWYYGTLAMYQHQGPIWDEWNERMKQTLLGIQDKQGPQSGSWNPGGGWLGPRMGRVVTTAMATLSLEVYYRYLPLYGHRKDDTQQAKER